MAIATHLVKIKGKANIFIWPEKKLRNYVDKKIKTEIELIFHPSLELFKLEEEEIEIWVYVSALLSEATEDIVEKWLKDHIVEKGLKVENFEIEKIANMLGGKLNKSKMLIYLE